MKNARRISLMLLATALLAACSSDKGDNNVPTSWIRKEYGGSGIGYVDTSDSTSEVAREINGHSKAKDRTSSSGMEFLRYKDDMVAISPHKTGSKIEIDDYRTGYRRWRTHVHQAWPDPDSSGFRGGGPGSGK